MSLSPEKMAEFLANELMDDMEHFADYLLKFEDRWSTYGQQHQHLVTAEKRAELEACFKRFHEKTKHLAD